ncbi:MAG: hypothetical protein RL757_442 [Bacteroidota bacterium]|jgi:outer membrane receptor protein involved in Fe transport
MKKNYLIFQITCALFVTTIATLNAQKPTATKPDVANTPAKPANPMANLTVGKIYGKIVEKQTERPIPYASVQILQSGGPKPKLIGGALSVENGDFSVAELAFGRYQVKVTALGFKETIVNATVAPPEVEIDLGDLKLEVDATVLQNVDVTAQKTSMQLSIDKKVFNVDKNLASQGGTAEQVLRNVPSVNVDNDGNAQLRNQNTTIYIDGRPAFLSLNQIPADQIEQVEVITNPSAKFEASATGGIINLVMKKNKKTGYNGFVSLGGGTFDNFNGNRYNATLNLNAKQGKWNMFGFFTLGGGENSAPSYTNRTTFGESGQKTSSFYQNSVGTFRNLFQNYRAGFDYSINNRNTFTLAASLTAGQFKIGEDQFFDTYNGNGKLVGKGDRTTDANNRFQRQNAQLTWKRTYAKKGKELTADLNADFGGSHNVGYFKLRNLSTANTPVSDPELQTNTGDNVGKGVVFQLDFVNPINDSTKLEFGLRNQYQLSDSKLIVDTLSYRETPNAYRFFSELSNHFQLNNWINAIYINYSSKYKSWGYQTGVRYEQSNFFAESLLNNNGNIKYDYPSKAKDVFKAVFPALFLSRKIDATTEWQINVSRKLNRPNFMQMLPVIMFADKFNLRVGNPNLRPEFVNLAELNFNKTIKTVNLLMTAYYKNTEDPITQIADLVLPNGQQRLTFINGSTANAYGLDNTLKFSLSKRFDVMMNANIFNVSISSDFGAREDVAWTGKATATYRLPKDFTAQLNGGYQSRQPVPQGFNKSNYGVDFSVKKDFSKTTSLNFSITDLFDTRRMGIEYDTPTLQQDLSRRRETRNFRLTYSTRFGKVDASIFKRPTKRPSQQQDENF